MRIVFFGTKSYDREVFEAAAAKFRHEMTFLDARLTLQTAELARGYDAVCVFVNDTVDAGVLKILAANQVRVVALRCAGFNNVDVAVAAELGIRVVRVPAYSPEAVAEHSVGLILSLNRRIHRAYARVRDGNFSLEGLLGFDLRNCTVGVVGTGQIGLAFARIMAGFGCKLLAYDKFPQDSSAHPGLEYVALGQLFADSDIISLHCPLTPETHHLVDGAAIETMKPGVMIINTNRGAVIDTRAVIEGLKAGKIGHVGLDVYEEEADFFFEDLSNKAISDDTLARLLTFPNVLITGHQGFFTRDALCCIADTTLQNIADLEHAGSSKNEVRAELVGA